MSTDLETYRARLLLALRMRDVPGVRIGEALAEVDSHVAETGEDPRDAFGDPVAYADRLAGSLDAAGRDDARRTPCWTLGPAPTWRPSAAPPWR